VTVVAVGWLVAVSVVAVGWLVAVSVVAVGDVDENDTECVSPVSLRFGDAVVAVTVVAVGCLWLHYRWLQ
jgi:hypothetical protein